MSALPFDREIFMANFRGMEDLARETVSSFLSTLPVLISAVESAIQSKNASDLELAAHTLKGAISNFYAEPSRVLAWKLEVQGKERKLDGAEATLLELKAKLGALSIELQKVIDPKAAA